MFGSKVFEAIRSCNELSEKGIKARIGDSLPPESRYMIA